MSDRIPIADMRRGAVNRRNRRNWPNRPRFVGQSMSALPGISDVDLFRYRQGIIHLDAEVSDGAFDLSVAEQELDGP